MQRLIDLTGQKFDLLTVMRMAGKNEWGKILWLCNCDCGKEKTIIGASLKNGRTQSCGCKHKAIVSNYNTKHGHNKDNRPSPTYNSWHSMIQRCTNPNHCRWKYYGGRGISVCKSWRRFDNFLRDMGKRPVGKSIDRIDTNGNYCPSNCRWATPSQQQKNTRRTNHDSRKRT